MYFVLNVQEIKGFFIFILFYLQILLQIKTPNQPILFFLASRCIPHTAGQASAYSAVLCAFNHFHRILVALCVEWRNSTSCDNRAKKIEILIVYFLEWDSNPQPVAFTDTLCASVPRLAHMFYFINKKTVLIQTLSY